MKLKHLVITAFCVSVGLSTVAIAEDMSDLNLIGNFSFSMEKGQKATFDADNDPNGLGFSYQSDFGKGVRANGRIQVTASGLSLNEAYLTLDNPFGAIGINSINIEGLSVAVGKKSLNVGLVNDKYAEELPFVAKPVAVTKVLGTSSRGEGAEATLALPTSFDSSIQVGAWQSASKANSQTQGALNTPTLSLRASGSMDAGVGTLGLGLSALMGKPTSATNSEKTSIYGLDASYNQDLANGSVDVAFEYLINSYYTTKAMDFNTAYLYAGYNMNNGWSAGVLYDHVGKIETAKATNQTSLILTRSLSDAAKLRVQYGTGTGKDDSSVIAQIVFGIGH